ncbi:protein prenyltransferase alpha subunit, putative [Plasmodium ovale]|uniref:Geranylgeranyl transferase type-2 subunit alpha n=1 Tax=Plasmodium ovale TaxID=36330 RepID=A0A1D3TLL1_PLAOA|nr:protein prenyltransferase alpha subunit, putative [Plasmodium ovale]
MHGRRANNPMAEQVKLEKVKEIIPLVNDLIKKKKNNQYEKEYIDATSVILRKCPYLQTLWNYRREYFESIKNEYLKGDYKTENIPQGDIDKGYFTKTRVEDLKKMMKDENTMIEEILCKFNKCNELWFHKLWIVKYCLKNNLLSVHDLLKELEYCKGSFYLDDRNYHCWNYRSYVIACVHICMGKKACRKVVDDRVEGDQIEKSRCGDPLVRGENIFDANTSNYELSKLLIEQNFSNFSAWFLKYSLKESLINIDDELNLIKNAIFTDPFDQSLWEFYRWFLFKKGNYQEQIFFILLENNCIYIFFHNLVKINTSKSKCYNLNNEEIYGEWNRHFISIDNPHNNSESYVYIFKFDESINLKNITYLKLVLNYFKYNIHEPEKINYEKNILQDLLIDADYLNEDNKCEYNIIYEIHFQNFSKNPNFKLLLDYNTQNGKGAKKLCEMKCADMYATLYKYINYSNIILNTARNVDSDLLSSELEQIDELLYLEDGCKFALFTKFEILKRLEKFDELFQVLEQLKQVDHLRAGYYKDRESEITIQGKIHEYYRELEIGSSCDVLDLSSLNIDNIVYPLMIEAFFIPKINLSNNRISESCTGKFTVNFLYNLRELNLSNNQIKRLDILMKNLYSLKFLEKLDVSKNILLDINEDLDKFEFVILPVLNEIHISDSNISLLLNEKYKDKHELNTFDVVRTNGKVTLAKVPELECIAL